MLDFIGEERPLSVMQGWLCAARPFVTNAQTFEHLQWMLCWEAHVPHEVHKVYEAILALGEGGLQIKGKFQGCPYRTFFQVNPRGKGVLKLLRRGVELKMHEDALANEVLPKCEGGDITRGTIAFLHNWILELNRLCDPSNCGQSPKLVQYEAFLQQSWAEALPRLQAALSDKLRRCMTTACRSALDTLGVNQTDPATGAELRLGPLSCTCTLHARVA